MFFYYVFVSQVTELECVSGQTTVIKSQKTELNQTIEELELELKAKEEVCNVDVLVYREVVRTSLRHCGKSIIIWK